MGIISDFVIAQPNEAAIVIEEPAPTRRWPGVEAKGIGTIKLATLKFILDGKPLDTTPVVDYSTTIKNLAIAGEDGPWVFLVPEELVRQLAEVPAGRLASVAKQWHQSEEFQLDRWSEPEVLEVLGELRELASAARSTNKSVLLFLAL